MKTKTNLGDKVKDIVTGFTGIVTAHTRFLNGCTRVGVQSQELHEGKPSDAQWFDEPQLEVLEVGVIPEGNRDTGGPMVAMPRRAVDVG